MKVPPFAPSQTGPVRECETSGALLQSGIHRTSRPNAGAQSNYGGLLGHPDWLLRSHTNTPFIAEVKPRPTRTVGYSYWYQ